MSKISFKEGDIITVIQDFEYDRVKFTIGSRGTVKRINKDEWGAGRDLLGVEWDFKHSDFHDLRGKCPVGFGFNIPDNRDKICLASEAKLSANPLPEDPRLRSIAIKIYYMENRFKMRQLQKLKERESKDEEYKSVSLQDGVIVSSIPSSITWSSTSSF